MPNSKTQKKILVSSSILAVLSCAFYLYEVFIINTVSYGTLWIDLIHWTMNISLPFAIFAWSFYFLREIQKTFKRLLFALISTIAIFLLPVILLYKFTPLFDYAVIDKSLTRLCEFIKEQEPEKYDDFEICHIGE